MPILFLPTAGPFAATSLVPARCLVRLTCLAATSATATAPVTPFAVDDYLIANCHLTPSQAVKASKRLAHLKSASNADAVLVFLADFGLSPEEVAAVVASNPRVLCARIDHSLAPISEELRALSLSPSQIAHFAQSANRYFLCCSFVSKVVEPNVAFLKQCGLCSDDIAKLLIAAPRLVTMPPEYVQDAVRRATQLGSQMFRHALSTAGSVGQEKLDAKVAILRKTLGWSDEELNMALSKAPRILVASEERLHRTAEFLLNQVGLPPHYIARRSVLPMYSLERRLAPRHFVLKMLKEKGLVNQDWCFLNAVAPTEEKFWEKFVAPYEECIPGLTEAYEDACSGDMPEGFQQ